MWVSVIRSEENEIKKEIRAVGNVNIQQNVYIIYYCCSILWWSLQLRYDEGDTIMVIQDHVIENPLVLCYTKSSTLFVAFCSHDNRVSLLFILFFSILSFSTIQTNRILIFVYNNKKKKIYKFVQCVFYRIASFDCSSLRARSAIFRYVTILYCFARCSSASGVRFFQM